jgi:hypothetical protein
MKKLISIILFTCISAFSFSQFSKEDFSKIRADLKANDIKGITSSFDKHSQTLWLNSKVIHNERLSIKFYFGIKKKENELYKLPMRIKVRYAGSDWIFIDKISFANMTLKDGEEMTEAPFMKTSNENHDVVNGGVIETIDNVCDGKIIDFIRATINEPRWIEMRATGKSSYTDLIMTKKQVLAFDPIFKVWDLYK